MAKGGRILVVEDEMLLAMALKDLLVSYGFEVVGPASRSSPCGSLVRKPSMLGSWT